MLVAGYLMLFSLLFVLLAFAVGFFLPIVKAPKWHRVETAKGHEDAGINDVMRAIMKIIRGVFRTWASRWLVQIASYTLPSILGTIWCVWITPRAWRVITALYDWWLPVSSRDVSPLLTVGTLGLGTLLFGLLLRSVLLMGRTLRVTMRREAQAAAELAAKKRPVTFTLY